MECKAACGVLSGVEINMQGELSCGVRGKTRCECRARQNVDKSIYYKVPTVFVQLHRASYARPPGYTEGWEIDPDEGLAEFWGHNVKSRRTTHTSTHTSTQMSTHMSTHMSTQMSTHMSGMNNIICVPLLYTCGIHLSTAAA